MTNYNVGDFLIRIKNAALAGRKSIVIKKTNMVKQTALALVRAGYLDQVVEKEGLLDISLAFRDKQPVLTSLKLVSKPGLRVYKSVEDIQKHKGPSFFLVSTAHGILSSKEVVKKVAGGEVIAEII